MMIATGAKPATSVEDADTGLDRDVFLRELLRELSGTLESIVGLTEAQGYISVVGRTIGERIDRDYRKELAVERLSREQVRDVLVDLKRRIQGKFYVIEERANQIVFGNTACPFGSYVEGRPSLCMMTSNVFGRIAADNLGYARVEIEQAIATGHPGCRVVVNLSPAESEASTEAGGQEFFRVGA